MSTMQLSQQQQELFKRAKEASNRSNHEYAVTLLKQIVIETPTHLEARRMLRANELLHYKTVSTLKKKMSGVKIAPLTMKAGGALKKSPQDALKIAEDILEIDPTNAQGNELLAEAGKVMSMPSLVVLAFETLRDANPDKLDILKKLGSAYIENEEYEKALKTFERAVELAPSDGDAQKGMKDASARHASQKGSWESGDDYRDSLKNADKAKELEQESRVVKSTEAIDEELERLSQKYSENNNDLNTVKKIADLYERKNDFSSSIQWYEYAFGLGDNTDPEIEKKIHSLKIKQIEINIQEKEKEMETAPPENQSALQTELDQLLSQEAEFKLSSAKDRVDRYPNDLQLRFELGHALFLAGHYKDAIPQLQQALNQPNARTQAINALGMCYWKRKMLDFAEKQFRLAKSEMTTMDNLKKEVIYNLGCVLEDSGKKEEGLNEFKEIYEIDSQFRDVAERVESSYE